MCTRVGAALGAMVLHGLALAAVLCVWTTPAAQDGRTAAHLTVMALTSSHSEVPASRSAATRLHLKPHSAEKPAAPAPFPGTMAAVAAESDGLANRARAPVDRVPSTQSDLLAGDDGQAVLADYSRLLWQHIAAHRPRGVQASGAAVIRFRLSSSGALLAAELDSSSGNFNLDRIALRTVRQSAPMPKPPVELSSEHLIFTIPVAFH